MTDFNQKHLKSLVADSTIDPEAERALGKAKSACVVDDPFYGYFLLKFKYVQTSVLPTAAVDGVHFYYNPDFIKSLTKAQLLGLVKHEVLHVCYCHHLRRQERDPQRWNVAADYVINALLQKAGEEIPESGLIDEKYAAYSTEHTYTILPEQPQNQSGQGESDGENSGQGGDFGVVLDHPNAGDPQAAEEAEADVKLDVISAAEAAKMQGKEPAGLDQLIDKIKDSKLPWRRILSKFFKSTSKSRESWLHPNKRYMDEGIILPTRRTKTLGPVVIGLDTSGSVSTAETEALLGCVTTIMKHVQPEAIHLVYCDAAVEGVQTFKPGDKLTAKQFAPVGGGGTSFQPVFDYVADSNIRPSVVLYLTDMYAHFPEQPRGYSVIWCATSDVVAPWGRTLRIEV